MASTVESRDDKASIEVLSAPQGWKKMIVQKKAASAGRSGVVFVSPTGEEIKSKTQLDRYLKSHHGSPSSSEFDWSTGDTPRRSRRISEKSKATESPESEPAKKRQAKSLSKQADDNEDEEVVKEKEDIEVGEEPKTEKEVEMKDAETIAEKAEDEGTGETDGKEHIGGDVAGEEPTGDKKEEAEKKKELEGTSGLENEKEMISSVPLDEKVEDEAPSKADDDAKEEEKVEDKAPPKAGDDSKEEKKHDNEAPSKANDDSKEEEKVKDEAPPEAGDDSKEEKKPDDEAPSKGNDDSKEEEKVEDETPPEAGDDSKEEKKTDDEAPSKANDDLKQDGEESIDKEAVPAQNLPGDSHPMGLDEKTVVEPKASEISC